MLAASCRTGRPGRSRTYLALPLTLTAVTPVHSLTINGSVPIDLVLSMPVLSGIFLGRIQYWNDSAIAALNPHLSTAEHRTIRFVSSCPSSTLQIWMCSFESLYLSRCTDFARRMQTR